MQDPVKKEWRRLLARIRRDGPEKATEHISEPGNSRGQLLTKILVLTVFEMADHPRSAWYG